MPHKLNSYIHPPDKILKRKKVIICLAIDYGLAKTKHNYCSNDIDINMKYIIHSVLNTHLSRFQVVLVIIGKYRLYMAIRKKNLE